MTSSVNLAKKVREFYATAREVPAGLSGFVITDNTVILGSGRTSQDAWKNALSNLRKLK